MVFTLPPNIQSVWLQLLARQVFHFSFPSLQIATWTANKSFGESAALRDMICAATKCDQLPFYERAVDIPHDEKYWSSLKLKCYLQEKYFSTIIVQWASQTNGNFGAITHHIIGEDFKLNIHVLNSMKLENGPKTFYLEPSEPGTASIMNLLG